MLQPARSWVVLLALTPACGKDKPPAPKVAPPAADATGMIWIAEAGHGGEEPVQVAVDSAGTVYYAGRLRDAQRVAGTARPSATKDDAPYLATRGVVAGTEWARAASARISQPYVVALASVGGGRAAVVIDANHEVVDWGLGMVGAVPTGETPAHLEAFRSERDAIPRLGLGVYVLGQAADDVVLLQATRGDAHAVASDGAGVIVVGGLGAPAALAPEWKRADATACEAPAPVMVVRWRDAAPDWAACLPFEPGEPSVSALALAPDGDVVACIDVSIEQADGETSWDARLVRLDGDTGTTAWSVEVPEHDGERGCDGLAITGDGHVVLGQEGVETLTVFSGDAAPALDAAGSIRNGVVLARGLAPSTIVVATGSEIREVDVVSGDVRWTHRVPDALSVDAIAAGGGLIVAGGSYDEAFDGGAAGKLRAPGDDDLAGFVFVLRP